MKPMQPSPRHRNTTRYLLGALLGFTALNAFGGGVYGLAGAQGAPLQWLDGTPFDDYFVPSLILFAIVGGSALIGAVAALANHDSARRAALGAAAILMIWIATQVTMIGYVSWLQPAVAITAVIVTLLANQLPSGQ